MVNSPSRPNSRPIDPPAPVDCGGLTPLCHRETSLPVQRTGRLTPPAIKPNQTKSNQSTCREFCVTLPISQQSRQKPQQSRLIVPNQASSRQTMNFLMVLPPPVAIFNLAFSLQHLAFYPQTPVIVPHQGISRHIKASAKKHPSPWNFSRAWRLAFNISSPPPLCDLATPRLCVKNRYPVTIKGSIKAKTPAIVHNQGISRQTANFQSGPVPGAATTKPATRSALAAACASHPHPQTANQGRNPCNRA